MAVATGAAVGRKKRDPNLESMECPRSSVDRAPASGAGGAGSSPAEGTIAPTRHRVSAWRSRSPSRAGAGSSRSPPQARLRRSSPAACCSGRGVARGLRADRAPAPARRRRARLRDAAHPCRRRRTTRSLRAAGPDAVRRRDRSRPRGAPPLAGVRWMGRLARVADGRWSQAYSAPFVRGGVVIDTHGGRRCHVPSRRPADLAQAVGRLVAETGGS